MSYAVLCCGTVLCVPLSFFQEQLLQLPKFGPRKASNMLAAIENSKSMDLATLLHGLGIE